MSKKQMSAIKFNELLKNLKIDNITRKIRKLITPPSKIFNDKKKQLKKDICRKKFDEKD